MVLPSTVLHVGLVWVPVALSLLLSFGKWDGTGGFGNVEWAGLQNYSELTTIEPKFIPALTHNIAWLAALMVIATPLGLFLAVLLDRNLKGSRFYQGLFYMPVMLSMAVVGLVWKIMYSPRGGFVNELLHVEINWLGDPSNSIWSIIVAAIWRQTGYVMVLYLAGLKGVDPSLKEAASIDGASTWQTFRDVVFPVMKPVNIVIVVISSIEALRAYDLVDVVNGGKRGLELISVLVTDYTVGEGVRVGTGSALAVILALISLVPIVSFLYNNARKEENAS